MKGKILSCIAVLAMLCIIVPTFSAGAVSNNETYTYSYEGKMQISPAAYDALYEVSEFGEASSLNAPKDIFFDKSRNYIIIADTGNNRIVVTDTDFKSVKIISTFVNAEGTEDTFNTPSGVYITDKGDLYVADTNNSRLVVFDSNFNFKRILPPLSSDILPEGFKYNPIAVAVDRAERIYVVSQNSNMGVIALDTDGSFEGFIGAQEVTIDAFELLKRAFMTEEQISRSIQFVPVEFSNLTVDEKGFVYVTSSQIDRYSLYTTVQSRSKDSAYAPIKKINPAGTDVLNRNGFFPPVGDVIFDAYSSDEDTAASEITEVSLLDNGMYALLDSSGQKIFVYDSNSNLLYAFGGEGTGLGMYTQLSGMAFNDQYLYLMDSADSTITVLQKTEYGNLIDEVIGYQDNREFDKANELWQEILVKNNNFDMAYLGLGKIALEEGDYDTAMHYFRLINNKDYWGKAFELSRKEFLNKYGMIILAVVIILIFVIIKIWGKIAKYNDKATEKAATGKLKDQLLYGFYLITHPFKGYWSLKFEKRGSVKSATIWLAIGSFSAIFSTLGACYLQKSSNATIVSALANTLFPLMLWCISNVCFTTLMNGKGTFKDVYIAVAYASVPYSILTIPCTLISYVLIESELTILSLVTVLGTVWVLLLIFCGMMTIHDYSLGKNFVVSILTIIGIIFILFIVLVFANVIGRMIALVINIIEELSYRS